MPSRHRRDSCPSHNEVGGFFFEFEAIRRPRCSAQVMAAVQDVMQNGPGAMKKYENDREVKAILDELRDIL